MAIILEEPTFFENILNYALFAGAIFQLVCIFSAITISQSVSEKDQEAAMKAQTSSAHQSSQRKLIDSVSKRGKKEKKKHR